MSGYLDIIFLLVLVVVIFSKLKSALGTGSRGHTAITWTNTALPSPKRTAAI